MRYLGHPERSAHQPNEVEGPRARCEYHEPFKLFSPMFKRPHRGAPILNVPA